MSTIVTINISTSELSTPQIVNQKQNNIQKVCYICKSKSLPPNVQDIGPYLIHKTTPDLIVICPCLHQAHLVCLKNVETAYICNLCNSIYQSSLASTVGLVFGLSYLGRALDELGLGDEIGPKLDGDEKWQDHEMLDIIEWLNVVHYATGFAGEALLGLVYIVGVCLVIGLDRTLIMISSILCIRLDPLLKHASLPKWINNTCTYFTLFFLGFILGTYLLFFSWIWASLLRHIRKRILNFKNNNP